MKTKIATLVLLALTAVTANAQIGDPKKHDARIAELLDRAEVQYEIDSDGDFRVLNEFDDGRTHLAWINSRTEKLRGLEIREIWALGHHSDGQLSADLAKTLLRNNNQYKLGAWKIQSFDSREAAVFYVQIAADADEQTLIAVLLSVLSTADEQEKELSEDDDL